MYLRGSEDRLVPRAAAHEVLALAPRSQEVTLVAPHGLLQTTPREAARVVDRFAEWVIDAR